MLTIRLTRKGKKNQPFFKVVVIDKRRSSKGGRAVEDLGYVDPLTKKKNFKKERVLYWISKGAKPSPSIHNLLVAEKIIDSPKIKISNISKKKKAEMAAAKTAAATPASTVAPEVKAVETPVEPAPLIVEPQAPTSVENSGEAKDEPKELETPAA